MFVVLPQIRAVSFHEPSFPVQAERGNLIVGTSTPSKDRMDDHHVTCWKLRKVRHSMTEYDTLAPDLWRFCGVRVSRASSSRNSSSGRLSRKKSSVKRSGKGLEI